jgi:hypothetical protein
MKKLILGFLVCASLTQANSLQYEIGIGVPYGGLYGGNINYEVINDFDAFIGFGITMAGSGYSIGTRYYPISNIRLTGVYGTNRVVGNSEYTGSNSVKPYKSHKGLSFGIGYYYTKGSGFVIDLIYIATSNAPKDATEGVFKGAPDVTVSLGYRF